MGKVRSKGADIDVSTTWKNEERLLHEEEGAEGEGIDAGAVEAADGTARIGDQGFAKKIKGGVDKDGGGGGFAEFVKELPEQRISMLFDGVDADAIAVEGKSLEAGDRGFQRGNGGHKAAVGGGTEVIGGALGGDGKSEGMETFAMLDELIDVFDDVFGKGRSEQAAIAECAMAEFGATLTPGDDLVAAKKLNGLIDGLVFAGKIAIRDFAVVEDGLDFLGSGLHAEGEAGEGRAAGIAVEFFAEEIGGAQGSAGVARDRLNINVREGAAAFEGVNEKNVQENAAGETQGLSVGLFLKVGSELESNFLEIILGAAGEIGADNRIGSVAARRQAEFTIELWCENAAMAGTGSKVTAIE